MITLIIQNSYCQQSSTRIPVTMAADENVQALLVKVAEECQLVVGTFALCSNSFTLKLDDPGADATMLSVWQPKHSALLRSGVLAGLTGSNTCTAHLLAASPPRLKSMRTGSSGSSIR